MKNEKNLKLNDMILLVGLYEWHISAPTDTCQDTHISKEEVTVCVRTMVGDLSDPNGNPIQLTLKPEAKEKWTNAVAANSELSAETDAELFKEVPPELKSYDLFVRVDAGCEYIQATTNPCKAFLMGNHVKCEDLLDLGWGVTGLLCLNLDDPQRVDELKSMSNMFATIKHRSLSIYAMGLQIIIQFRDSGAQDSIGMTLDRITKDGTQVSLRYLLELVTDHGSQYFIVWPGPMSQMTKADVSKALNGQVFQVGNVVEAVEGIFNMVRAYYRSKLT